MRKAYQTPVVEVTELDGDRHILLVANSLPGASELQVSSPRIMNKELKPM